MNFEMNSLKDWEKSYNDNQYISNHNRWEYYISQWFIFLNIYYLLEVIRMKENHDSIFEYFEYVPETTGTTVKADPKEEVEYKEEKEIKKRGKYAFFYMP